jgi:hypothetical protein
MTRYLCIVLSCAWLAAGCGSSVPGGGSGNCLTCADQGATCGQVLDNCGNVLECGSCSGQQTCGGGGRNVCGDGSCLPSSCETLGADCGQVSDNCSLILQCGECTGNDTCGGAGQDFACGCTPQCAAGSECTSDGCGGTCPGETCCAAECTAGQISCEGGLRRTCELQNDCYKWSGPTTCTDGCRGTECCQNECTAGAATCTGGQKTVCGYDGDCTRWFPATTCSSGACNSGGTDCSNCAGPGCTLNAHQCVSGRDQVCQSVGGCNTWVDNGACAAGCNNAGSACCAAVCTVGQTECDNRQKRTCVTGASGCPEWSAYSDCPYQANCESATACPVVDACPEHPVRIIKGPAPTNTGVCNETAINGAGSAGLVNMLTPTTISGESTEKVSSCVILDFGEDCTPTEICINGFQAVAGALCGDNGTNNLECNTGQALPPDSKLRFFYASQADYVSDTSLNGWFHEFNLNLTDSTQFLCRERTVSRGPVYGPLRYLLVCQADCGTNGMNSTIDEITLRPVQ